jgi:DnaJ-class molecular chaperone
MRERRICTMCHGDRCVASRDGSVMRCPTCNGDGVELLELAPPLSPQRRQLVIWHQLDLPVDGGGE